MILLNSLPQSLDSLVVKLSWTIQLSKYLARGVVAAMGTKTSSRLSHKEKRHRNKQPLLFWCNDYCMVALAVDSMQRPLRHICPHNNAFPLYPLISQKLPVLWNSAIGLSSGVSRAVTTMKRAKLIRQIARRTTGLRLYV